MSITAAGADLLADIRARKTAWLTTRLAELARRRAGPPHRRARRPRAPHRPPNDPPSTTTRTARHDRDAPHRRLPTPFRSLRHRNFRLFFAGQLISQTGTWLSMVTQTLLVLKLTDSGVALGLLTAFQFGPMLLLGAWAGAVADRADKRKLLMHRPGPGHGPVARARRSSSWPAAATVPVIFALAAVQGVLTAFDNPARRSFVVEMVPAEDLPNAVSLNSAVMTGSRVVGPAAAGALVLCGRLRLAVHHRRPQLHRRARRPAA